MVEFQKYTNCARFDACENLKNALNRAPADLFIAGAVLQLVCLKKHIVAGIALDAFAQKHPEITRSVNHSVVPSGLRP